MKKIFETYDPKLWVDFKDTAKDPFCSDGRVCLQKFKITVEPVESTPRLIQDQFNLLVKKETNLDNFEALRKYAKEHNIKFNECQEKKNG